MDQWVDCALNKKCMYGVNRPKQDCRWQRPDQGTLIAYNGCQRFDQPTLNLIVAKYFGKKRANEIQSRSVSKRLILFDMQLMCGEIT